MGGSELGRGRPAPLVRAGLAAGRRQRQLVAWYRPAVEGPAYGDRSEGRIEAAKRRERGHHRVGRRYAAIGAKRRADAISGASSTFWALYDQNVSDRSSAAGVRRSGRSAAIRRHPPPPGSTTRVTVVDGARPPSPIAPAERASHAHAPTHPLRPLNARRSSSVAHSDPPMSIAPSPIDSGTADALARDSELLSSVLHDVLVEQIGEGFARTVRWLHESAADVRNGDASAGAALEELVRGLPQEEIEPCIRACALQLQLANIAEERERVRRRRHYDATGVRQRESLMEAADLLRADGADLAAAIRSLHVELVLTAHPTEATRRSVLDHQLDVAKLLDGLDDPRIGRSRRRALRVRAARGADDLVADRRGPPRPADGRGRGPPQPVLLRGDAPRRGAGGARGARALLRGPRRRARAGVRLVGGLGHGRPPRGRRRDARPHALAASRRRAAAAAREGRRARAQLLALVAPRGGLPRAGGVAGARRAGAAVGPRAPPGQPPLRAAADEARLHHPPAGEHARPARPRARLRRARGAARRPLARARRASARRTSPMRACAG